MSDNRTDRSMIGNILWNAVDMHLGWADCPIINLYDKEGLIASPLRMDDLNTRKEET